MARVSVPDDLPEFLRDHIRRYLETDGADGHLWDSTVVGGPGPVPTLLLTTRGRKTGNPRILPMIYDRTPTGFAVIASKAGAPTHPAWYLNLVVEPVVDVQVADRKFRARARTAEGAERDAIWRRMVAIYPPYDHYQARTERVIPVVVLEPLDP